MKKKSNPDTSANRLLSRFVNDQSGATAIEYGLIAGLWLGWGADYDASGADAARLGRMSR